MAESSLSNVKWGANGINDGTAVTPDDDVPKTVLAALAAVKDGTDAEKLAVIQQYADLTSTPVATLSHNGTYSAVPGYYLIKYTEENTDVYTTLLVAGDVDIRTKSDVPSFVKKIKDTNDSTGVTSGWQDSADYDIGDQVPFKLEGTVAANYGEYTTYYFAFHDKQEKGLTFNKDSVKVYVDGTEITSGYTVITDGLSDGCTFEIKFSDLKKIAAVKANSKVTVEYTSELNKNATLGNQGNENTAHLEYSDTPGGNGTGETPDDTVIVFTYKIVVDKYADSVDGDKLKGAAFTLEKVLADGSKKTIDVVTSDDGTSFTFTGLDDGDYILTETTTPDGYNPIAPIKFTVTAAHEIIWDGANRTGVLTDLTGKAMTGEITFTANTDKSELATKVVNKKGATLPSTGGIGTTIFYVVGGGLMAAAVVLFITKKRMENDQ